MAKEIKEIQINFWQRYRKWICLAFVAVLALGASIGYFAEKAIAENSQGPALQIRLGQKGLINPLLACGISENKQLKEFTPLKQKIQNIIDSIAAANPDTSISIYFRELVGGKWTGIGENDRFSPASLLKVPTMIAYYKMAEQEPAILQKTLVYKGSDDANGKEYFKPAKTLKSGFAYTVDDLIKAMIADSDNNAAVMLIGNIDLNSLFEVYTDLGLPLPPNAADIDYISPKSYAFFYRVLYNATYLNDYYSNKALKLLAESNFTEGLRAGIPSAIAVAQKFGERAVYLPNKTLLKAELHDCGIIYYPNDPYILCVMTKGKDFSALASDIQTISKTVYDTMSANNY